MIDRNVPARMIRSNKQLWKGTYLRVLESRFDGGVRGKALPRNDRLCNENINDSNYRIRKIKIAQANS